METGSPQTNITALHHTDDGDNETALGYRSPPSSAEAEQALLGAILVNNRAFEQVSDFLRPEHFADPVHGRIFDAITKQIGRGQEAKPPTLQFYFERDEALAERGGAKYLVRLAASVVTVINARDYGSTIHDLYLRRQLIALGEDTVNEAYEGEVEESATNQIERAEQRLYDLATSGDYSGGFRDFTSITIEAINQAEAAYKRDGDLVGVATGLTDLDKLMGGLHPSDLIILAGRPSMGKTALATNIAFHAAKNFRTEVDEHGNEVPVGSAVVGFFSLEMASEQLATRIIAEESGVSSDRIRRGDLGQQDFDKIVRTTQDMQRAAIFIDDTPALSVSALRTRARRLQRQHGLGLIVVDYLQLLSGGGSSRQENRVQEISEITRGLKTLAKELHVPVIALSQLSRQVEQREDKRPQLSDLRESGSIEQDADVVLFVFREEYYVSRREPREGTPEHATWQQEMESVHNLAEVIIAKQRHGPTGNVKLMFNAMLTKFANLAREDYMPQGDEYP
jgi:replicative DNA helicase